MAEKIKSMALYSRRTPPKSYSFKNEKVVTVPNQSMTLKEIIRRFTRKEPLAIEKQGFYETRFGDIDALQRMDITERLEAIDAIRQYATRAKELLKEKDKPTPPPTPPVPAADPPKDPPKKE